MEKIKVGDKVMVKKWEDVEDHYGLSYAVWRGYQNRTYTVLKVIAGFGVVIFHEDSGRYAFPAESLVRLIDFPCEPKRIVILQDGTTTRAIEYEGRRKVKEAVAKLHPNDEYRWETGRDLALNRLIYGTDYHPSEVALQKEEKPLYNGKVVCVDPCGFNCSNYYTVGKVYQFKDGFMLSDRGIKLPAIPVHSFDEWATLSGSKWIEIVE